MSNLETAGKSDVMPPRHSIPMPMQDFHQPHKDPEAPVRYRKKTVWIKRVCVMLPVIMITATLTWLFATGLGQDGLSFIDVFWIGLVTLTLFWLCFVVCLCIAGFLVLLIGRRETQPQVLAPFLDVAVLMPIHEEDAADVFANIGAMLADLRHCTHQHRYSFFILSDSHKLTTILEEQRQFAWASVNKHADERLFYRRRADNAGHKIGNLTQWLRNWGGAYDAALVLDADSLMSAKAIVALTNRLAQNANTGLVQGPLSVARGRGVFARLQQFSCAAFGALPAKGLALWSAEAGNYFGHNAIFRINAFAACAGLPNMTSRHGKHSPVFSHDFVEAALLRRAGWGVEMMTDLPDSFEQTPETLIDYIRRDRRWCQGNMQHLRIMISAGLHPVSRFHMLHNALGYLMSPIWCLQIMVWIGYGLSRGQTANNHNLSILFAIIGLLLLPKIASAAIVLASSARRRAFGGTGRFLLSFFQELAFSIVVTPTIMIHQTISVLRSIAGLPAQWITPVRKGAAYSLANLLHFHRVETGLGLFLLIGVACGILSIWTLPVAASLGLAPLISHFSGWHVRSSNTLVTPLDRTRPSILDLADCYRKKIVGVHMTDHSPDVQLYKNHEVAA